MSLAKRDLLVRVHVSWDTELFESVKLYSVGGLEMAGCSAVALGRETAHFRSHYSGLLEKQLFKSVEIYLGTS